MIKEKNIDFDFVGFIDNMEELREIEMYIEMWDSDVKI